MRVRWEVSCLGFVVKVLDFFGFGVGLGISMWFMGDIGRKDEFVFC